MRTTILTICALIMTCFVSGCLNSDEKIDPAPTTSAPATNATVAPKALLVTASDATPNPASPSKPMGWTPKTFAASVNDTIQITLKGAANNQLTHTLVIDNNPDPNFKGITGVKADSKTGTFVALKAGSYAYYCSTGGNAQTGHRALGMEGILTIS